MTYRDLLAILDRQFTTEQLDMDVTVSAGCDESGNAEFFKVTDAVIAEDRSMQAGTDGVLHPDQFILLFEE